MNTEEIETYMLNDPCILSLYGGVLAKDQLPVNVKSPSMFVVNLDTSDKAGIHWIVIFVKSKHTCEYFDPLGDPPDQFLTSYMMSQSNKVVVSSKQCQATNTASCGKFCLYFCFFRSRNNTMKEILQSFTNVLLYNEAKVYYFYKFTSRV